ncbi:MAG: tandem-95 repeat protein [Leptolyngbyaceae cyanobacterium SL_7_1]|nr:tandem-95 repeat protein [Leptolyngbyaceae cyanobacterium SL_7_1]
MNDAPTIAPSSTTVLEGGNVGFSASNFGVVDVDNQAVQIILKIGSMPNKGYLTLGGSRLAVGSTFSYDQVEQLQYHHDGTQTSVLDGTSDGFSVTVDDGAGGTVGSTTIPITITPVNQLPTVTAAATLLEGELDHPISLTINDPDQSIANYTVKILSLPSDGVLNLNGSPVTAGQTLTSGDVANLTYTHDGNDDNNGFPPPDAFLIEVSDDGGGTGISGSTVTTVELEINPNNDDPTLITNNGISLSTDSGNRLQIINSTHLSVADPDSATTQLTYILTAIPTPTVGTLQLFDGGTWKILEAGTSFTQDDLNDGRVRYEFHQSSSGNQSFSDSFSFQVQDGEVREYPTVREGGIWKTDGSSLETFTFNISIDVPAGSTGGNGVSNGGLGNGDPNSNMPLLPNNTNQNPPGISLNTGIANLPEGTSIPITSAMLQATDSDGVAGELVYRIEQLPTSGVIKLDGIVLNLHGSFTQKDIDQGRVTFQHSGGEDFIDQFAFTLSDGKNTTAFETTFQIDITPQNDRPVATVNGTPTIAEGQTITIGNSFLTLSDVDGTGEKVGVGFATPNSLTFQIEALPAHGSLQVDQGSGFVAVTGSTLITRAELDGGKLRYVHNGTENFADSFSVRVNDNSGASNNLSASAAVVAISIAKLNDNPAPLTSLGLTVGEGGVGTIKGSNGDLGNEPRLVYVDPDNSTIQRQYRVTSATANGTVLLNGKALAVGSVFSQDDLDNNRITYKHNGSENYIDNFNFTVSDGGGTSVPGSYAITINPANDAPRLTVPGTQLFNTDTPFIFSSATSNRITVSDLDLDTLHTGETDVLQVTLDLQAIGVTYTASTLTLGSTTGLTFSEGISGVAGGKITFSGTEAAVQAALDGLQAQIPMDEDRSLSLIVTVIDLNNGGPDPTPLPPGYSTTVSKTITLNTSNDNDAPIIVRPASVTASEDVPFSFTGGNTISVSDVDTFNSTNSTVTLSVTQGKIAIANTGLIIAGANNSTTMTLRGSLSAINSALAGLSYQSNSNFNGSDTLTVVANDQGNTGLSAGASDPKTDTQVVAITIAPVNDTPTLSAPTATQTIANTNPLIFSTGNNNAITIDDLLDLNNNGIDNFTVTLITTSNSNPYGALTAASSSGATITGDNSPTVTIAGTKAQVNAALNGLSYVPTDYNSESVITLGINLNDNANGGPGALTATSNVTINVSDINNAAVINSPANVSVNEDALFTFTGVNAIAIADPDDFGGNLEVTLSVAQGDLTLNTTGLSITGGSNGSNTITIRGTEAAINTALGSLTYQGDPNINGSDSLNIAVNDLGNTGSGGATSSNSAISITINPMNDAPTRNGATVTLPSVNEDSSPAGTTVASLFTSQFNDTIDQVTGGSSAHTLAGIAITNNYAGVSAQGRWQWSTNGTTWNNVNTTISTSSALVVSADSLLRFLPNANFNGNPGNLTVRLIDSSQGVVTSGNMVNVTDTNSGGITPYSNDTNKITLSTSVGAVNDAPVATGTASLSAISEDTTNPPGATVSSLFGGNFSDTTDQISGGSTANSFAGVAIVGNAATTQGVWQYFNGSTWQDVGSRNAGTALLVSTTGSLRFVPAANYTGVAPALTVHLVDNSVGGITTGNTVNLSGVGATGTTTVYSSVTVPLTSSITPVNDAPTFSNLGGSVSFTENAAAVVLDSDGTTNDVDLAAINNWNGATLMLQRQGGASSQDVFGNTGTLGALVQGNTVSVGGVAIATVTTHSNGTLVLTFNNNATTALVNSALQQITYSNTSDQPPAGVTIVYILNDGNSGAQGTGGALTATNSVSVSINAVPDAVDDPFIINEDSPLNASVADTDTGNNPATYSLSSGTTNGTLTFNSNGTFSYTPNVNFSGTDSFTYTITDANGDSDTAIATITIDAVPDAVDDPFTINEDTSSALR